MRFELLEHEGAARRGRLHLSHGVVETPVFMPVGTYGTVKAMTPEELDGLGAQIVLGNTFHLMLRPGTDVIGAHGGLHGFMHWHGPDPHRLRRLPGLQPRGAAQDHRGGRALSARPSTATPVFLSPEISMQVQRALNSDIVMAFDECPPYPATEEQARKSMELLDALGRGAAATSSTRLADPNALFGIVQGGTHLPLRQESLGQLDGHRLRRLRRRRSRRRRAGGRAQCGARGARAGHAAATGRVT